MNTVVCIGDSLIAGKGWTPTVDPSKNLMNRLSEKYPGIAFVNLGVGGEQTSGLAARKADVDAHNPFRIICWEGINDVSSDVPAATIEANLQPCYTYWKSKGYELWVATISQKDTLTAPQNAVRDAVNTWIKTVATGIDRIIDAYAVIGNPLDMTQRLPAYANAGQYTSHINDAGYAALVPLF